MKKLILIIGLIALPFVAQADHGWRGHGKSDYDHRYWNAVDQRIARQYRQIENGIIGGELTHWEAKKLHRKHRRMVSHIDHLRHKRWLSPNDKKRVMSHLDETGDIIYRLKHNDHYTDRERGRRLGIHHHDNAWVAWSDHQRSNRF